MFKQLQLRFFKTEALEAALDFLEQPRKNLDWSVVAGKACTERRVERQSRLETYRQPIITYCSLTGIEHDTLNVGDVDSSSISRTSITWEVGLEAAIF